MEGNLDLKKLSRTVSHALRHEPWLYGLEMDSYGSVHLIDLVASLRRHRNEWRKLGRNEIIEMISKSDKRHFEETGAEFVVADLTNDADVVRALRGCKRMYLECLEAAIGHPASRYGRVHEGNTCFSEPC